MSKEQGKGNYEPDWGPLVTLALLAAAWAEQQIASYLVGYTGGVPDSHKETDTDETLTYAAQTGSKKAMILAAVRNALREYLTANKKRG